MATPRSDRVASRLARERKARLEAEAISERATRDLYDHQAALELMEAVAVAANEALTVERAMKVAVDRVCEYAGWPVGHVLLREGEAALLVSTRIWHLEDAAPASSPSAG